eukprot:TRINITY_DN16027_c0_g1_i2.p1 TRINITY_DN16027_c0_g1~~TRINITY_DN16027_c0_g1_i2.p1  ORF type:complete len:1098 (+),score=174.31 TRINITY_DN16027_c0_g1_i2:254-3547(+)
MALDVVTAVALADAGGQKTRDPKNSNRTRQPIVGRPVRATRVKSVGARNSTQAAATCDRKEELWAAATRVDSAAARAIGEEQFAGDGALEAAWATAFVDASSQAGAAAIAAAMAPPTAAPNQPRPMSSGGIRAMNKIVLPRTERPLSSRSNVSNGATSARARPGCRNKVASPRSRVPSASRRVDGIGGTEANEGRNVSAADGQTAPVDALVSAALPDEATTAFADIRSVVTPTATSVSAAKKAAPARCESPAVNPTQTKRRDWNTAKRQCQQPNSAVSTAGSIAGWSGASRGGSMPTPGRASPSLQKRSQPSAAGPATVSSALAAASGIATIPTVSPATEAGSPVATPLALSSLAPANSRQRGGAACCAFNAPVTPPALVTRRPKSGGSCPASPNAGARLGPLACSSLGQPATSTSSAANAAGTTSTEAAAVASPTQISTSAAAAAALRRPSTAPGRPCVVQRFGAASRATAFSGNDRQRASPVNGRNARPSSVARAEGVASLRRRHAGLHAKEKPDADASDEDEEAAELRLFWRQLRSSCNFASDGTPKAAASSLAASRTPTSGISSSAVHGDVFAGVDVAGAQSHDGSPQRPLTARSQVTYSAGLHPSLPSASSSPSSECSSPVSHAGAWRPRSSTSVATQRSRCGQTAAVAWAAASTKHGAGLWSAWPADVTFELLCCICSESICELACSCQELRKSCAAQQSGGTWRLTLPHLTLCSRTCVDRLRLAWLPHILCFEATNLNSAARKVLLEALQRQGHNVFKALRTLNLRHTRLVAGTVGDTVEVVRSCRGLHSLDLSQTNLRNAGVETLLQGLVFYPSVGSFSPHMSLRRLSLEANGLTGAVGTVLASVLQSVPLEVLLLANNELGDVGVEGLAAALGGGRPVGMSGGSGGICGGGVYSSSACSKCSCFVCCCVASGAKCYSKQPLADKARGKAVNSLADNGASRSPVKAGSSSACTQMVFCVASASNHRLVTLNLSQNGITATGFAALARALGANRTLQSLDLGGNDLLGGTLVEASAELEEEITTGLGAAASLRHLHLWNCGLKDQAFHVLARAQPPHLELFNLAMNPFSQSLRNQLQQQLGCGLAASLRV